MSERATHTGAHLLIEEMALVQKVHTDDVWKWLGLGWSDFKATWQVGVTYSAIFTFAGLFISFGFYYLGMPYLILPGLSGFLLVGPALGVGFYEISRQRAAGAEISIADPFRGFRRNTLGIFGLGIFLVFVFQVWIRLSFTVFAVSFPGIAPDWGDILVRAFSMEGVSFAIGLGALGGVFAVVVFIASAFAMPMMVDRQTILVPSMVASAYAVSVNRSAMLLWAALIVVFTGIGLATATLGLLITFPLIGHATWHAYRQVIKEQAPA